MAISYPVASTLIKEHLQKKITGKILLIGRQTVVFTEKSLEEFLKAHNIQPRHDRLIEIDRSTVGSENKEYLTDRSFFSFFTDAECLALDVSDYEGLEIVCDLNGELPDILHGQFDFIFNGSCLDNLFDSSSALINMSRLLRSGGRVVHIEHGSPIQTAYIMYSPAYFYDFYAINKFADCKILACLFNDIREPWNVFNWRAFTKNTEGEWQYSPHMLPEWQNIVMLVVAEKGESSTSDVKPIQAFYRGAHDSDSDIYIQQFKKFTKNSRSYKFDDHETAPVHEFTDSFEFVGKIIDPIAYSQKKSLDHLSIARDKYQKNEYNEALSYYNKAITENSDVGQPGLIYYERGVLYRELSQLNLAKQDLDTALEFNSEEKSFLNESNFIKEMLDAKR